MKLSLNVKLSVLIAALVFSTAFVILLVVYNYLSQTVHKNIHAGLKGGAQGLSQLVERIQLSQQEQIALLLENAELMEAIKDSQASNQQALMQMLDTLKADVVVFSSDVDQFVASETLEPRVKASISALKFSEGVSYFANDAGIYWIIKTKYDEASSDALLFLFQLNEERLKGISERLGMNVAIASSSSPEDLVSSKTETLKVSSLDNWQVSDNYLSLFNWRVMTGLQSYYTKKVSLYSSPDASFSINAYLLINAQRVSTNVVALHTTIALISLIAVVVAVLLGVVLAAQLTRPVRALATQTKAIAEGNYTQVLSTQSNTRELSGLLNAFEAMRSSVQERENTIHEQARTDPITGVYNRSFIRAEIESLFVKQAKFQAIGINISEFRTINDVFGFEFGDKCLKLLAERIQKLDGICARMTGGKLLWIPEQEQNPEHLKALQASLSHDIDFNGVKVNLKTAVCCFSCPKDAGNAEILFRRLNILFDEGQNAADVILYFDAEHEIRYMRKLTVMSKLKEELENGGKHLSLIYQPKISLSRADEVQVEALARWQHPELGAVAPDEFVSVAEQAGFIRLLTEWVVRQAFEDLRLLRKNFPKLRLAINICADDLMDERFQALLCDELKKHQLNASDCILELTERVIVKNPDVVISKLLALRTEGFKIAIDDFGTGYSSLSYLTELPIDTLKIDRCFVKDLTHNLKQQAVCKTILSLAQNFDMDVVAEGVEDGQSLAVLKSYGCQWAQGFFISEGLAKPALEEWLQQSGLCTIRKTFSK